MVCVQVHGATGAVGFAGSQGNFELDSAASSTTAPAAC